MQELPSVSKTDVVGHPAKIQDDQDKKNGDPVANSSSITDDSAVKGKKDEEQVFWKKGSNHPSTQGI